MIDRRAHDLRLVPSIAAFAAASLLVACGGGGPDEGAEPDSLAAAADTVAEAPAEPGVLDVTAVDYAFQGIPAEIPSGWTTIRLHNEGAEPHFMVLWKLAPGKTLQDYVDEVSPPFNMAYDSLEAGTVDAAGAGRILGRELPAWMAENQAMGGPGILTPGHSGQVTVELEPGTYVAECYMKDANGTFHGDLGMLAQFTVTADSSGRAEPAADLEMTLTNDSIGTEGPVSAGEHTIAVHYDEQPPVGLGNDVHVARLTEDTSLDDLSAWMDWMNLDGMETPAPVEFLGGVEEMPAGATSYFTITLEPGRYAWVSEASSPDRPVEAFTVE